ncbi:MAG: DUF4886 domain-containing protein [Clostridia bacterium]|nr:DUF4886 domain-containing protein [Clostridia bacterium]
MKCIIIGILVAAIFCTAIVPTVFAASQNVTRPTVKILSIGHSYAWNSVEYLRNIAESQGVDLVVGVVYRGNCSLEIHLSNFEGNKTYGDQSGNPGFYLKYDSKNPTGTQFENAYSIAKAVKDEKWDYIMFQECLNYSGYFDVINKSLPKLKEGVSKLATNKNVKYMWHDIWALEKTEYMPTEKVELKNYNFDQATMYNAIKDATKKVMESDVGLSGVVPTGEAFALARKSGKYDPTVSGGISLNADEISHANVFGKYLAGLVWYMSFTGCAIDKDTLFYPQDISKEQAYELVDFATEAVEGTGKTLGSVNDVFFDNNEGGDSNNTSSQPVYYNPDNVDTNEPAKFNPLYLIPVGAAVVISGGAVALAINKKKKNSK